MTSVQATKLVRASVSAAYHAFTNATALREWLCDVATVVPRPNGRIYLWWNGDFYSSGHFFEAEPDKKVRFRWFSNIDPGPSEITVSFETQGEETLVTMTHNVPEGEDWAKRAEGFRAEWQQSLDNLASVLETGKDLRIVNRPMLGIVPATSMLKSPNTWASRSRKVCAWMIRLKAWARAMPGCARMMLSWA